MQEVCSACLCEGPLVPLIDMEAVKMYHHILTESLCGDGEMWAKGALVCVFCLSRLHALARFRRQATHAHTILLQLSQEGVACTPRPPRLQLHRAVLLSCNVHDDQLVDLLKEEPKEEPVVKPEPVDVYEQDHFADALASPPPKSPVTVKVKKKKKKARKGRPSKRVRQKEKLKEEVKQNGEDSSDGLSDLGSLLDLYTEDAEKTEAVEKEEMVPGVVVNHISAAEISAERAKLLDCAKFQAQPHKCMDCIRPFTSENALDEHLKTKHSEAAGEYECEVCRVRVASPSVLASHRARHALRYSCAVCGTRAVTAALAAQHARTAHRTHTCDVCGEVSGSLSRLRAHVSRVHSAGGNERPRCTECDKSFSSRKTYRYHLSVIHEGRNRFPCPHCGKVYQWKSNLWRHMKNHAARAAGELYCAPCRRPFASVATYTQHLRASRRHVDEDQFRYVCSDCGRRYPTKTRLRDHVDWDHLHTVNHRCHECDKPFKSKMSLYVHVKNVHSKSEDKQNLCHVCGKSYQNQAKLKYHIVAMHTTETPYSCARCGASFGWYSSLYRHQREVHDKIKLQPKRTRSKKGVAPPQPAAV